MEAVMGIILIVLLVLLFVWIGTLIFTWLWNITMPEVFGLKLITFWQGFRLLIIAGFLFGTGNFVEIGDT